MKKFTIAMTALVLMISADTFAQTKIKDNKADDKKAKYLSVGPMVGMGMSWVNNSATDLQLAGEAGVAVLYSMYEHWGWGGSVAITREGYRNEYNLVNGVVYKESFSPSYIRITPKAYYFFGSYKSAIRPKVYLAPSVGLLVAENHTVHAVAPTGDNAIMPMHGDVYRSADYGAEAGVGVNIRLAKGVWLNLDDAYYHGISNATVYNLKNRSMMVSAGLLIGL